MGNLSANNDVIDWDVDNLDEIAQEAHDEEANKYDLANFYIF
jgi:hypothetical protein